MKRKLIEYSVAYLFVSSLGSIPVANYAYRVTYHARGGGGKYGLAYLSILTCIYVAVLFFKVKRIYSLAGIPLYSLMLSLILSYLVIQLGLDNSLKAGLLMYSAIHTIITPALVALFFKKTIFSINSKI